MLQAKGQNYLSKKIEAGDIPDWAMPMPNTKASKQKQGKQG